MMNTPFTRAVRDDIYDGASLVEIAETHVGNAACARHHPDLHAAFVQMNAAAEFIIKYVEVE